MSGLERVGRLPVFIDEEQWSRAYDAARREVELLSDTDGMPLLSAWQRNRLAIKIATAALRAAAQDADGDIADVAGVQVSQIPNDTPSYPRPTAST